MDNLAHSGTIKINTDRLYLKKINTADALQIYNNFANDDRVSRYM